MWAAWTDDFMLTDLLHKAQSAAGKYAEILEAPESLNCDLFNRLYVSPLGQWSVVSGETKPRQAGSLNVSDHSRTGSFRRCGDPSPEANRAVAVATTGGEEPTIRTESDPVVFARQGEDLQLANRVEDPDASNRRHGDALTTRSKGNAPGICKLTPDIQYLLPRFRAPQFDLSRRRAGHDDLAIRSVGHAIHGAPVYECEALLSTGRVPETNAAVETSGGDLSSVWAEDDSGGRFVVSDELQ